MEDQFNWILTIAIFFPMVGGILILFTPQKEFVKLFAILFATIEFILCSYIFLYQYTNATSTPILVDLNSSWFPTNIFNVQYFLGVDGISAPFVFLTGLLGLVAIFASWNLSNTNRIREHFMWLLVLQGAVVGVFTSLDLFMFFIFWELELIPMYFLISIWGSGRKHYSAMKFLIFTILGSAFMLVGVLGIYFSTDSFNMIELPEKIATAKLIIPASMLFLLTIIGFAVKLPVFPLHTWLPDAHTDAPTAASVMLAGVLLKMGGYGMLRISASMFPNELHQFSWIIALLGTINIIYGAVITIRQTDLKRLIAYSSVSHMGFVLLGLSAASGAGAKIGITGASMQMFTHGTITGLLFLTIGFMYDRTHTRYIPDLSGLAQNTPILATGLIVAGLASLGLPATSGFIAEITIFLGAFQTWPIFTSISAFGVVLTAGYVLWMIQRTLFQNKLEKFNALEDASIGEMFPIFVLIISIIGIGIFPSIISDMFSSGLQPIISNLQAIN